MGALPDMEDWEHGGFGLYVHWPFCQAKCPYCDFNSHVVAQIDQRAWADAYLAELDRVGEMTQARVLKSVFFGGGTPSLMDPSVVDAVLTKVRSLWSLANTVEITLEANPTSVEAGRFAGYRDAGVNRISMGVQALNDHDLKALGRLHSTKEAMDAFDIARKTFSRVSFDLIYARQGQTVEDWTKELRHALSLAVDHLSLYQLTIEDGTAFGDRYKAGKLAGLPDEDLAADLWDVTQEICRENGFEPYEVSNHAKAGAESIHNKIYWNYGDYAGIGPGAHGRLTVNGQRCATEAIRAPGAWMERVKSGHSGDILFDPISSEDQFAEFFLMGLRLKDGVDLNRVSDRLTDELYNNINYLSDTDFLENRDGKLAITDKGRPLLNGVLRQLLGA